MFVVSVAVSIGVSGFLCSSKYQCQWLLSL